MGTKKTKRLSDRFCQSVKEAGLFHDGGSLYLQVTPTGAKTWIFRFASPVHKTTIKKTGAVVGRQRGMGLGPLWEVNLAEARDLAIEKRKLLRKKIDPIDARNSEEAADEAKTASRISFEDYAKEYIKAHRSDWKNAKHIEQWERTFEMFVAPVIGAMSVADVDTAAVLRVLRHDKLWETRTETASRIRGRIEAVLDAAKAEGLRVGDNPATWAGHLETLLADPGKLKKENGSRHQAALPFVEVGAFIAELRKREGIAARALEFLILTAARSGEVRGATWAEIDLESKSPSWTVPEDRMKMKKPHRVPLSPAAVALLKSQPRVDGVDFVFPAPDGGQLSDMTLAAVVKRMNKVDEKPRWIDPKQGGLPIVPHGFRSTFRDWGGERTNYPTEVLEMALAHTKKDKVELAYWRGDLYEKRAHMMSAWATYCNKIQRVAEVVDIGTAAHA